MSNKRIALDLIDQMIEKAQEEDEKRKVLLIKEKKASKIVGESWMVFHLKALKGLVADEDEWYNL
tara:strand:- start:783 stop:977 length:195 start_codon:yes stop_codon:yes gene_type:complete